MHQETSKKQKAIKLLGLFASFSLLSFIYAIFQVTFLFVLLVARLITEEGVFELSFHFPELKVNDELISFWDIPEFYIFSNCVIPDDLDFDGGYCLNCQ